MERDGDRVLELFMGAVGAAGGPGRMLVERRSGWLPALMASSFTFVMQEEEHRDPQEIANLLGSTRETVENILTGPPEEAIEGVLAAPPDDVAMREQIAGGLIRHVAQRL